jgi:ComF family protein
MSRAIAPRRTASSTSSRLGAALRSVALTRNRDRRRPIAAGVLTRIYNGLLELLAPAACSACGGPLEARSEPFCAGCAELVELLEFAPEAEARALYRYGGPVADAVRRLKYEGRSEIAAALGPALRDCAAPWLGRVEAVLPIPIASAKLRARGYNQSGLLARELARGLGAPYRPGWLSRTRHGPGQVGTSRAARLLHVRGAFSAAGQVQDKALLLVDDVRTTGATLGEASRCLQAAGARSVFTLVVAQVADMELPR